MNYTGEIYCQYANAYVGCSNKKCVDCNFYKQSTQKKNPNTKNKQKESQSKCSDESDSEDLLKHTESVKVKYTR